MKVKKVYKYATGQTVPDNATYLCTKTETETRVLCHIGDGEYSQTIKKDNSFVWHYFLVEVEENK